MKKSIFLDVGGVLLTDGWDRQSRVLAAQKFDLELDEFESRHRINVDTFEIGKLTLEEYLNRVVFYRKRTFSRNQFQKFMFAQSKPFPKMIHLAMQLKTKYGLKIAVVSNESRELNEYRIRKYRLDRFVDFYVSSCIVRLRKPDVDIYRLALSLSQVPAQRVIYIENSPLFTKIAADLGMQSILHTDFESTRAKLASLKILR